MKKNLTELVFILDRSGKSSSKFRVPFIQRTQKILRACGN